MTQIAEYDSLEEAFFHTISSVFTSGSVVSPRSEQTTECCGLTFRIKSPRARLIFNAARQWSIFYAIGELFWNFSGSNDLGFISYYSRKWSQYSDDDKTIGGSCYGVRLFTDYGGASQWEKVKCLLKSDPGSRRAVLSLFDRSDSYFIQQSHDIPCTCTIQFFIRNQQLNCIVYMRSNDLILGFGYDIFLFTMLQERMALELGYEIGWYQHCVGSLHIYEKDYVLANNIIHSSYNTHSSIMIKMDRSEDIPTAIDYERMIRSNEITDPNYIFDISSYWNELLLLLLLFQKRKNKDKEGINTISARLKATIYYPFISA